MNSMPPEQDEKVPMLEYKVTGLECELKIFREHVDAGFRTFSAELRAEIAAAIAKSNDRTDARLAELEQRMRWITGLLLTMLFGMGGMVIGLAGIWVKLS